MVEAAIWAVVVLYFLVRVEVSFKSWLKTREPLSMEHHRVLTERLNSLQNQVNALSVNKEFE